MHWYNVKERMPQHNEKVVVYHTIQRDKCIDVAIFRRGISQKEREILKNQNDERARIVYPWDEWGNNFLPWLWTAQYGPSKWFGEEVEWWCPLSEFPFPE